MAHFAKLKTGNIVERVEKVSNDVATTEQAGIEFLNNIYGENYIWKQTSYNTHAGVHRLGGTPFRKNFAGIGWKYDQYKDAFIPPQPYPSWTLNETTCVWEAPVIYPTDGQRYNWNEENQTWDLVNE
jgi:hypothetical protein